MSELRIVELDPFDAPAFGAWHRVYKEAELAAGPGVASPWQLEEVRAMMQHSGIRRRQQAWSGLVGDDVVAVGWLRMPLLDNIDRAEVAVHTLPAHRRRGHGSAMLAQVEDAARQHGRTILVGESAWAYADGPDGAGPAFAAAHGFALALEDVKRTVDLPIADAVLEVLAAEAAARHPGHTLRSWAGPVPDELLDGWARIVASMTVEAPMGDLEVEAESADPAAVRENEAVVAQQGRTKYNTVALDEAGDLVAYTDLATSIHEPGKAYQWGTLVRRDARGHRLGLAVKVANLRHLQAERPDITLLTTYNAEVNERMIEVNERLGFTPVARLGEFQKRC